MMLLVGLMFAWAGAIIDPASNCNEAGECAAWLVPVAKWMGFALAVMGASQLWVNPRRGSRLDRQTGELSWWQDRTTLFAGKEGRIPGSQIGAVRIVAKDDGKDEIHLYDLADQRQAYFDSEVVPDPERWAEQLVERWPHIRLEKR